MRNDEGYERYYLGHICTVCANCEGQLPTSAPKKIKIRLEKEHVKALEKLAKKFPDIEGIKGETKNWLIDIGTMILCDKGILDDDYNLNKKKLAKFLAEY
jgi:hypothetical protein